MNRSLAAGLAIGAVWLGSCANRASREDLKGPMAAQLPAHPQGLHNLQPIGSKIISGSVPEGDVGFAELKAMGVRTIISVDGAKPDLARAKAQGMRYIHIPVTYADVTDEQRLAIARAVRDLPGRIYVHCHHGKHRSPAASAAAAVTLGIMTPEEGVAYMKQAGTAPNYTGLYACVGSAVAASAAALNAAPAEFPEVRGPEGIVAAMIHVDEAFERLSAIRSAGWTVPRDHPDLVPASEAGQLADQLRFSGEDARATRLGEDFRRRLDESVKAASALEEGLLKGEIKEQLEGHWKLVAASCKDCHAVYRDVRK